MRTYILNSIDLFNKSFRIYEFRSMDVSKFESSLVLQSLGWWPLGYPKLSFAGSDASEEEKFVFSCAMIDYEPSVHAIHLAALRRIFMVTKRGMYTYIYYLFH